MFCMPCHAGTSPLDADKIEDDAPKSRLNINYVKLMKKIWVMAFCEMAVFTATFAYVCMYHLRAQYLE